MSQESFYFGVTPTNQAAGTVFILTAPSGANGGGITVTDVAAIDSGAHTIPYKLLKYSNAASPALNGTVATLSGTFAAGTTTLVGALGPNNYLQAGESLVLVWTGAGTPAVDGRVYDHYQMGRQAV